MSREAETHGHGQTDSCKGSRQIRLQDMKNDGDGRWAGGGDRYYCLTDRLILLETDKWVLLHLYLI